MKYAGLKWKSDDEYSDFYLSFFETQHNSEFNTSPNYYRTVYYQNFLEKHKLKKSSTNYYPYWGKLLPLDARQLLRSRGGYTTLFSFKPEYKILYELDDHGGILYRLKNEYLYYTQPYNLKLKDYMQLESLCRSLKLYIDISYKDAWHNPGACPLIVISQFPIELEK